MRANVQRDGRPDEYRRHSLRKLRNSIPGTTPQSLSDIRCWSVVNARLGRKVNFARGEIPSGGKSPRKCIYSVAAQETAKHRAKFGWLPVSDVAAVRKPRRETR